MVNNGVLNSTATQSPLQSASLIAPKSNGKTNRLVAAVILTSLIDAFSILVIYLLVNFSTSGEVLYINKDMELPMASESVTLKRTTLVKIEKDTFYIEDEAIDEKTLLPRLIDVRKELAKSDKDSLALTVQADRRVDYKTLNHILLAGSQAGFEEIKFAVLVK